LFSLGFRLKTPKVLPKGDLSQLVINDYPKANGIFVGLGIPFCDHLGAGVLQGLLLFIGAFTDFYFHIIIFNYFF
jgi:hypothetical protein